MKKILFFLVLGFAVVSCKKNNVETAKTEEIAKVETKAERSNQLDLASSKVEEGLPETTIEWNKKEHDFGNIKEGDIVKTTFKIKNTGNNPLVINQAKGSCGCTIPKVDKNIPIAPGESAEVQVEFNSNGRTNKQTKTVSIYGNFAPNPAVAKITAMVEAKPKPEGSAVTTDDHEGHDH